MRKIQLAAVLVLTVLGCAPRQPATTADESSKPSFKPEGSGGTGRSQPASPGEPGAGCPQGCATPPAGCLIKGNINLKTGDRVYHVPGQLHYNDVTIEPERGEFWFCTEDEAMANGWRRAKR